MHVVIHGSPHPYNVLLVNGKPTFIDFETACIGPIEWDLAHMSPDTARSYAGAIDSRLLETCRDLVRVGRPPGVGRTRTVVTSDITPRCIWHI